MAWKNNKGNSGGSRSLFDDDDDDNYSYGNSSSSSGCNSGYDGFGDDSDSLFDEDSRNYWPKPEKKSNPVPYIIAGFMVLLALFVFLHYGKQLTGFHGAVVTPAPQEISTPIVNTPNPTNVVVSNPTPTAAPTQSPELTNRYFRRQLNSSQQEIYDKIRDGVAVHAETISFETADEDDISLLLGYVLYDYPEYFWYRGGGSWTSRTTGTTDSYKIELRPEYEYAASEYQNYAAVVEAAFQPKINELSGCSDYEKVVGVYEYLIDYTEYDDAYVGKSIYEMARDHRAVCEGYARATQYMLTKLGVETLYVVGNAGNGEGGMEGHAWNIVKLDGEYYNVDTTWGDPVGDPLYGGSSQTMNHAYLCVTDIDLQNTHMRDDNPYPTCSGTKYNWYRQNNRYMETYDEDLIASCIHGYGTETEIQFATDELYNEAMNKLFDNGRMFNVASKALGTGNASISYVYHYYENMRVISVVLN